MPPRRQPRPAKEPSQLEIAQAEFANLSAEGSDYRGAELQLAYAGLRLATDAELTESRMTEEAAVELKLKAAQVILDLALKNKDAATATQIGPTIDTLQHIDGILKTKPESPKKATSSTRTTKRTTGGLKT
jgi:hypothetical protein